MLVTKRLAGVALKMEQALPEMKNVGTSGPKM